MTTAARSASHAAVRLSGALCSLELQVQVGCLSHPQGVTVQDVMVDMAPALQHDVGAAFCSALLQWLHLYNSA